MDSRVKLTKVHFFEMVAQEKFSKYLRSALLYIVNVAFDRYPNLVALRYHKEKLLSALEIVIQAIYLHRVEATYSEYYYGIKRYFEDEMKSTKHSKLQLFKTLIVAVVIPIVKQHVDSAFVEMKDQVEEGEINERNTSKMKLKIMKVFLKVYPVLSLLHSLVNFLFSAKYLLDPNAKYYSILYRILGQPVSQIEDEEPTKGRFGFVVDFFKRYFVFAIYLGTKFLEWYYDTGRRRSELLEKELEHIDAPFVQETHAHAEQKHNMCPICQKSITIPCCLDTCGYVFCQVCVYDFVQKHAKCPITNVECSVNNIHKIYET